MEEDLKNEAKVSQLGPKSGVKTSEFWTSLITQLLGVLITAFGLYKGSDGLVAFGGILTGSGGGAYALSRASVKKASA